MKTINKIKDYVLPIYLIINILYLTIGSFLFFLTDKITMKQFANGYIGLLCVNTFIIVLLFIFKKYKKNKIDIFLMLISIFAFISYLFAYKRHVALFGCFHRYEGLFMILYYVTIVFISSFAKQEHKKIIIYFILLTGIMEFFAAFCQKLDLFNIHTEIITEERLANGFTNNPNFFATLMLICLSLIIGLFFDDKNISLKKKVIYIVLICLYMIGLLFSNTTSCLVGLIFVLIYLFIYSRKNKDYEKLIRTVIIILITTVIVSLLGLSRQISDFFIALGQIANISVGHVRPEYGTSRIYVWTFTLKKVPKYLLTGIGIDCFKYIDNGMPIPYWLIYDKCHNEYLQILITMGIFSLLSYLGLYFTIVKNAIRKSFKTKEIYLLLPVIGYLVQAFFNISVIEVAPLFYIILGLLGGDRYEKVSCK